MPRIREEIDADLIVANEPTEYVTELNRFALACEVCGRRLYVDRGTLEDYEKAAEHDLEYSLVCAQCEQNYDAAAFE